MEYVSSFQNNYTNSNYKIQYNTDEFYNKIIKDVSIKLKRPLEWGEQKQVINFIKNMDSNLLTPMLKGKTIPIMITTLAKEFSKANCGKALDIDSHQIIRDTIGISSESGTTHGIYDNPNFMIARHAEQTKEDSRLDKLPELEIAVAENEFNDTNNKSNTNNISLTLDTLATKIGKTDIKTLMGISSADEAVRILNPKSQYRRNHMLLDSRYRIFLEQSCVNIAKYQWNYVQNDMNTQQGSVNIIGNVRDIIGLRILPFRIPYSTTADNAYARISVFIEELSAQSYIAHEGRKFHFMMNATIDSDFIILDVANYADSYFWFERPITALSTLTISFGNPIEPIVFERDRDFCGFDYFSIAPLTQITTEQPHNLQNGDRVYFTNFKTASINPILYSAVILDQNITTQINSVNGHLITIINSTQFSISVDTSQIQSPIANLRNKVYYGSKRFFLPFEMIFIKSENSSSN
jgi:hypothetical protein